MKTKKVLKTIMSLLIILILFSKNNISISKKTNIETYNKGILEKVNNLQNLAQEYIEQNNITTYTCTDLCMQYIRKDRYNTNLWNMLLDNVDKEFIKYLESKENVPTFKNDVLLDPNTGKEIDFPHMIVALNAYLKNGDMVKDFISTHYAGWAGDLITLLEEVTLYRIENNIEDKEVLQEYSNSLLGTNNPSTFSSSDILADLDAIALYKDSNNKIKENLYNALYKYYINNDSTYNANNRLHTAQTILGTTKEKVKQNAKGLLMNGDVTSSLLNNSSNATYITNDDIDIVSQSFANYVYGVPYLKLQESKGNGTVGKTPIDVKIIESNANLVNANIEIENNKIAKAEIYGEYLRITPLQGGETIITVYSKDRTASCTYELTSKNVVPSITKDLEETYELTLNVEKTFSLEAEGTNNIYTWYIQNPTEATFNKVAESDENTYKLLPTLEMNNIHIKCGVKNDGNAEIFSTTAKIVVNNFEEEKDDNTNQDDIQNGDNNEIEQDNNQDDKNNDIEQDNILENEIHVYPNAGNQKNILLAILILLIFVIVINRKLNLND